MLEKATFFVSELNPMSWSKSNSWGFIICIFIYQKTKVCIDLCYIIKVSINRENDENDSEIR